MIIVKVMGGLGNQLFQYAFGMSLEMQCQYRVKYDISYYENIPQGDTKREVFITQLIDEKDVASKDELDRICGRDKKVVNKILKQFGLYKYRTKYERPGELFEIDTIRDNTCLVGYWQSEIYFEKYATLLKQKLNFSHKEKTYEVEKILRQIESFEYPVSIHIRGGDYLEDKNQAIFGNICTPAYYRKAFEYVESIFPQAKFFVFSNDIAWAKENINLPYDKMSIVSEQLINPEDWVELYLMSKCRINIIANSSYSWWAAWLNNHGEKKVLCPSRWTNFDANEMVICKEWIKIDGE